MSHSCLFCAVKIRHKRVLLAHRIEAVKSWHLMTRRDPRLCVLENSSQSNSNTICLRHRSKNTQVSTFYIHARTLYKHVHSLVLHIFLCLLFHNCHTECRPSSNANSKVYMSQCIFSGFANMTIFCVNAGLFTYTINGSDSFLGHPVNKCWVRPQATTECQEITQQS